MPSITINESACSKDGLCSIICPLQIISPPEGLLPPKPIHEFNQWCISCGHCVSICPTGAIRHSRINPTQCPTADYKLVPGSNQFEHILRLRRSIRRFQKTRPEKEIIERLISIARYAPSGHNLQAIRWQVFADQNVLNRLVIMVCDWMKHILNEMPDSPHTLVFRKVVSAWDENIDLVLHHAPVLIVAHSINRSGTEATDAAISLAYLDLAALSLGLGCCWAGLLTMAAKSWPPLKDFLDFPSGHQMHGALMAGYPKLKFQRLPERKPPEIRWR